MKKEEIKWLEDCLADDSVKIQDLEHQLAEKDKEIERLKQEIEDNQRDYVSELAYYTAEENIKQIRHQVCQEIREKAKEAYCKEPIISSKDGDIVVACLYMSSLNEILDQIEGKGE